MLRTLVFFFSLFVSCSLLLLKQDQQQERSPLFFLFAAHNAAVERGRGDEKDALRAMMTRV